MKAVCQEFGDGDGIFCMDGVLAHPLGNEEPVQVCSDQQAYRSPKGFLQAGEVGKSGKSHQEPAAHVRSFGAESGEPGSDGTTAEEVVTGGLGLAEGEKADGQHEAKVEGKREGCKELIAVHG